MKPVRKWQLQDAKNRLSEVVDEAQRAPQVITRRGEDAAVVVSPEEWARLARIRPSLLEVLQRAPRIPGGLDITRSKDSGRDVDL